MTSWFVKIMFSLIRSEAKGRHSAAATSRPHKFGITDTKKQPQLD